MSKNKKIIKGSSVILSALLLTSGLAPSVSAASEKPKEKTTQNISNVQLQQQDVINTVQQYIHLNQDGTISLDKNIPNTIAEKYQTNKLEERFTNLNERVKTGQITINSDFSVTENSTFNTLAAKSSKVERHEEYWWGHKNWYNNRQTKNAIDALNTAAATAGIAAGLSSLGFPPGAFAGAVAGGYWMLLATRMGANNNGSGVTVSMTWALVYNVESR